MNTLANGCFQYDIGSPSTPNLRTSSITLAQAEQVADAFAAAGVDSPYSTPGCDDLPFDQHYSRLELYPDVRKAREAKGDTSRGALYESIYMWEYLPVLYALCRTLPDGWTLDVAHVQAQRVKAAYEARRAASYEAVANPAIRAYLLAQLTTDRYARPLEARSLADLRGIAMQPRSTNRNRPYQPKPGCTAKLHLKEALCYAYEQACYADHSRYVVPVTIPAGADLAACRANLAAFLEALRTHNGFAGSGCTWSGQLHEGGFVTLDCRASISD